MSLLRVACTVLNKKTNKTCNAWLGAFDVDRPNTAHYKCLNCGTVYEYSNDGDAIVKVVKNLYGEGKRQEYFETITKAVLG